MAGGHFASIGRPETRFFAQAERQAKINGIGELRFRLVFPLIDCLPPVSATQYGFRLQDDCFPPSPGARSAAGRSGGS